MNNKEKIINILINELCYCYCDNCEYGNFDKYGDDHCEDCHRKYQNWKLAEYTAEKLADKIDNKYKEIINFLLQWIEDDHYGSVDNYVKIELKDRFNYEIDF